jgi:D-2-hydroxyacid dehydrogenase (NADP+)
LKAVEPTRCPDTSTGEGTAPPADAPNDAGEAAVGSVAGVAATVLFCSDRFWDEYGEQVVAIDPTVEVVRLVGDEHVMSADLDRIEVAYFSPDLWPERSRSFLTVCLRAPQLRWLQTCTAGTDDPVFGRVVANGATLTNASGASAPAIGHTVMLYLLALSRGLPALARAQAERRWEPGTATDLEGLRLGVVGLGAIGREVARLAAPFGIETIGVRRSVRGDEPCPTWTTDRLPELLGWADAIVVTASLNPDTRRLFDAAAFAAMRRGAWFVNVGRGEIADEEALADALRSGQLGGAALDVFATEPLPATSPLWTLDHVIITPHMSGDTDLSDRRAARMFLDNFARWTTGAPLHNVAVDVPAG